MRDGNRGKLLSETSSQAFMVRYSMFMQDSSNFLMMGVKLGMVNSSRQSLSIFQRSSSNSIRFLTQSYALHFGIQIRIQENLILLYLNSKKTINIGQIPLKIKSSLIFFFSLTTKYNINHDFQITSSYKLSPCNTINQLVHLKKREGICLIIQNWLQMIEVLKQKEHSQQQIIKLLDANQHVPVIPPSSSNYHKDYQQFFEGIEDTIPLEKMVELLSQQKIRYVAERDHTLFSIHATNVNVTSQLTTLLVELGPFDLELTLLNNINKNYTHYLKAKASTFATIYQYSTSSPQSVIKCTAFKPKDFLDCLVNIVKEYSFLKIAGILEIGPKVTQVMGFDFVAYVDCIEFSMEKCLQIKQMDDNKIKKIKQKIKRLHKLHIVHADIKPQNFCLSPTSRQPIFIDFGLSEVISQNPGQTTHTFFMGSLSYCSKEMSKLYYESTSGPVDLYYNDTLCMARSFVEMASQTKNISEMNFLQEDEVGEESEEEVDVYPSAAWVGKIDNSFILLRVKHLIYQSRPLQTWLDGYRKFVINNKQKLITFIKNLHYSSLIEQFCEELLPQDREKQLLFSIVKGTILNYYRQNKRENIQVLEDVEEENNILKIEKKCNPNLDQNLQMISARMVEIQDGLQIKTINTSKKELMMDFTVSTLLESPHLIANLKKEEYFRKFILFTDLRNGFGSKFQQSVVNIMLGYLGASQHLGKRKLDKLGACWDLLLKHFLSNQSNFAFQVIPALFHNLMIIEHYSEEENLNLIPQFGKLFLRNHIQKFELLYLCYTAIAWGRNRCPSRYLNTFSQKFSQAFYFQANKLEPYIDKVYIAVFYFLLLIQVFKNGQFEHMVNALVYINHSQNYLSNQAYFDLKITLISILMFYPASYSNFSNYKKVLDMEALFEGNLKVKYKFNHYHFRIQEIAVRMTKIYICHKITANFLACFSDLGLSNYFVLGGQFLQSRKAHNQSQFIEKIQSLTPANAVDNVGLLIQIQCTLRYLKRNKNDYKSFLAFIKKKLPYEFIMSLDLNKYSQQYDICNYFRTMNLLFSLFCQGSKKMKSQTNFNEQIDHLYQKLVNQYSNFKENDTKRMIFWSLNDIVPLYLIQRKDYQNAIEQYCTFLALSFVDQKFEMSRYFFGCAYRVITKYIHDQSVKRQYIYVIYTAWRDNNKLVRLYQFQNSAKLIYTFTRYLIKDNRFNEAIWLHSINIKSLQQNLTQISIGRYIWQTYSYIKSSPQDGRKIIQYLKSIDKGVFYQLKSYCGICVCLTVLGRQEKYDACSRRILKVSLFSLPIVKGTIKKWLSEFLYRYLLIRGTEYDAMKQSYLSFQSDPQFVQKLKKNKSRQKALWLRRLNQSITAIRQKILPISYLIKNYSKNCLKHKLFKQLLLKIRKNMVSNSQKTKI